MKKKIAVLLVAAMTLSTVGTAFAHQVIVVDPSAAAEEAEEAEEEAEEEEAVAEEAEAEEEEAVEEEAVEAEAEEAEAEEEAVEEEAEEVITSVTTSPNKVSDRTITTEDETSTTYTKVKEPKTIYNTAPSAEHPFTDVTGANEKYAKAAYALGMTQGVTADGIFAPDETLTIEDAVTFLYRLKDGEGKNGIILANISKASGYAIKPLTWAAGLGLVEKSVEPQDAVTVKELKDMLDKLGYTTNLVGTDNSMTRIEGLVIILDSIVGDLDKVNTTTTKTTAVA
ncbi:MAG: hypothetical protein LUE88_06770 [Clostridiales bacterium]|nr:hypothetical protein [Clostridiales bacterium]